jgi:LPS export ABC transporter protein LptC
LGYNQFFYPGMKKLKNILGIGILCVMAFWVGLYAFRTQKPSLPPQGGPATAKEPGSVGLKEINFVQVREGIKLWELKAEAVEYQQSQNLIAFKKVTLTYFPKESKPLTLVGNFGKLDTQNKNVTIEGEVVISSQEGYELRVPSLQYLDSSKEISSEGSVSFTGPHHKLEGQGMIMNLESQKVKVKSKARMTFYHSFFSS